MAALEFDGKAARISEVEGLSKDSIYEFCSVLFVHRNSDRGAQLFSKDNGDSVSDIHVIQSDYMNSLIGDIDHYFTEDSPSKLLDPEQFRTGVHD